MMVEGNIVEIGFVNVVASPHPDGIYVEALKTISSTPINTRGKDFAIITKPRKVRNEDGLYEGTISVWTDIDSSEPSIDKATFEQKNIEQNLKKIFAERGFNNRGFTYIFDERSHTIGVELRNTVGKTISIRQVGKLFEKLFSSLNEEGQTFEVTVLPEEDALEYVLGLDRLDKVVIVIKRPNPGDHHGGDAEEILNEMHEQNIKRAEYAFSRESGTDGIELNDYNQTRAEVASSNGYVGSSGIDDGEKTHRSTKEYPRIIRKVLAAGTLFASAIKTEVKRYRG